MKIKMIVVLLGIVLSMGILGSKANATSLGAWLTADDLFYLYISTDDSVTGTEFGTEGDWTTSHFVSASPAPGIINYLHIQVFNLGGPSGLLGEFTLSDSSFHFANGTQHLLTNTNPTDWEVYNGGFGVTGTPDVVVGYGINGVGPWGTIPNIDSHAAWIWTPNQIATTYNDPPVYFSAKILPENAVVPEPSTLVLVGVGFTGFGLLRNKFARIWKKPMKL